MPRKKKWRPRTVPKSDVDYFRRAAVLIPVLGGRSLKTDQDIEQANQEVFEAWRRRVFEFRMLGLPLNYKRMLSCRSAFIRIGFPQRDCGRWRICPFCWARYASEHWQKADSRLFGEEGPIDWLSVVTYRAIKLSRKDSVYRCPVDLIYREATFGPVGETLIDPKTGDKIDSLKRMFYLRSPAMRKAELELWGVKQNRSWLGMTECDAISFSKKLSTGPNWRMDIRQLWAIPPKYDWRKNQQKLPPNHRMDALSRTVSLLRNPSRQTLAAYMVRLYRYPSDILYGDVEWAAMLVEQLLNSRAAYPYGIFRKEDPRRAKK